MSPSPTTCTGPTTPGGLRCTYVLPIRTARFAPDPERVERLRRLVDAGAQVVVVDGSSPLVQAARAQELDRAGIVSVPLDDDLLVPGGKVAGVLTGVRRADHEAVVIADDDVAWDVEPLRSALRRLEAVDLVRPQNVFDPLPWHARHDLARSYLNRAFGGDYPGTMLVRRSVLVRAGGYRTDVLFENLELERTVQAVGGSVDVALDLVVPRRPPTTRQFLRQRVRQAYDSRAQPARLVAERALLPLVAVAALRRRRSTTLALVALLVSSIGLAEAGRRRGGAAALPASSSLLAPTWLLERAVCTWLAVLSRRRGGAVWAENRFMDAASTPRELARLAAGARHPWLAEDGDGARTPDGVRQPALGSDAGPGRAGGA